MKAAWLGLMLYCTTMGTAGAQSDPAPGFPSKPIRWIVGFAPGASNDVIAPSSGVNSTPHVSMAIFT